MAQANAVAKEEPSHAPGRCNDDREGLNEEYLFVKDDPRKRRSTLSQEMSRPLSDRFGFVAGRRIHLKCGTSVQYVTQTVCETCGPDTDD